MDAAVNDPTPDATEPTSVEAEVVVYWRPGCGFCGSLRRRLDRAGLRYREVDIWSDPDGAAAVRAVAGGNETVPTVAVAGEWMVNPPARVVLAVAAEAGIEATPPEPGPGPVARLLGR